MKSRGLFISYLIIFSIIRIMATFGWCANSADDSCYSVREIKLPIDKDELRIFPRPIAMHLKDDFLYIGDSKECCIKIFTLGGEYVKTIGKKGEGPGEFKFLTDFDIYNERLYALEGNLVKIMDLNGVPKKHFNVSENSYRIIVLDEGHIVISNLPNWNSKREPLVYCYDILGKLRWQCVSSKYSTHSVINTMVNQLLLVKGRKNEFFAIRKMNERILFRLNRDGKELASIKIPSSISFREVDLNFNGNKANFSDFCQDVYWKNDELFVLLKEYDKDKKNKDTMPGREIVVLNMEGELKYAFKLPDSFKKILGIQNNLIFGIDYDNSELRKFEIKSR